MTQSKDGVLELIHELCPVCDNEVLLDNVFIPQQCPSCQSIIFPCSICPQPQDCRKCLLERNVNESE